MRIELTDAERERAIALDRLVNSNPTNASAESAIRHMEAFKRLVTTPETPPHQWLDWTGLHSWQTSPWD